VAAKIFPFVLTGQRIDRKLYDTLNSYTGEAGSDGVVRVAAANANYGLLRLAQQHSELRLHKLRRTAPTAFGVLPGLSHSGKEMGIMRSVNYAEAAEHPAAQWVLRCLHVGNAAEYLQVAAELTALTEKTQVEERVELVHTLLRTRSFLNPRHNMIVFRIVDDRGESLSDYDLYFTAGPKYDENQLPEGFSRDRQRNQLDRGKLTYYLNYDAMAEGLAHPKLGGLLGFFIVARPEETRNKPKLIFYRPLSFNGTIHQVRKLLNPNETLMVEIQLERHVDAAVFQIDKKLKPGPISAKPTGALAAGQSAADVP
jgi:hypothetical protein